MAGSKETGKGTSLMAQERDDSGLEQSGSCVSSKMGSHLGFLGVTFGPRGVGYGLDCVLVCVQA